MKKQTVLITGASSGIGLQLAKEFASRGYNLVLAARRLEALEQLQQTLGNLSIEVLSLRIDVTDDSSVKEMYLQAYQRFGVIDKVIVNAGMGHSGRIGEMTFSDMKAQIDLNLTAAMSTAHHGVQHFRRQGHGHMVFVSSVSALRGMPGMAAYSSSKAGIKSFAEALRAETYYENLDVTILCPGYINTPIGEDMDKRPFVISVERAGRLLANDIEKRVKRSYTPFWPWAVLARIVPILPTRLLAKKR